MRKENIDNKFRFVLGERAKALTVAQCPPGELPNSDHLEAGIQHLQNQHEVLASVNIELKTQLDRLDKRYEQFLEQHRLATRNEVMMLGQIVRELHVFRQVLILATANGADHAERLMDKALPIIMELRGTLISWRAREGIEVPEYDHGKEAQMLERLIHNHSGQKQPDKEAERQIADPAIHRETEKER
ncbi:hypothetical protein QCN27_15735 [Cereibacter sp. SYSU M97828]|nr:hypothetical protein [Cereibacter flavus]